MTSIRPDEPHHHGLHHLRGRQVGIGMGQALPIGPGIPRNDVRVARPHPDQEVGPAEYGEPEPERPAPAPPPRCDGGGGRAPGTSGCRSCAAQSTYRNAPCRQADPEEEDDGDHGRDRRVAPLACSAPLPLGKCCPRGPSDDRSARAVTRGRIEGRRVQTVGWGTLVTGCIAEFLDRTYRS